MKYSILIVAVITIASLIACSGGEQRAEETPKPPVAKKLAHILEMHGDVRTDEYYWLRERSNPEVIEYLEAENAYTEAVMAPSKGLMNELFEELKNRVQPDESSAPAYDNGFYYYKRYEEGSEYPIYCRRKGSIEAAEEVILDVNKKGAGHDFCSVRGVAVSPDTEMMAWALDTVGRRKYTVSITDLATGEAMADVIPEVTGNLVWANDNKTLFYTKQHPETLRSYQVYRHLLGSDPAEDELIYEEEDETFGVWVQKTRSDKYIIIHSDQTLASEARFIDADNPSGGLFLVAPRERGVEYSVDHVGDRFIIRTNLEAENFRLMEAPVAAPDRSNWSEVIPVRDDVFLQGVEVFNDFMVLTERRDGLASPPGDSLGRW